MILHSLKHLPVLSLGLILILSGCAGSGSQNRLVPLQVGQTSSPAYKRIWEASEKITLKYFEIQKSDAAKGLIITEPRIDRDARGMESKRAFIRIQQLVDGYTVQVEVPYIKYKRYENIYQDRMKNGQHILSVEKKALKPPSATDIYLEGLIQSEILALAAR